MLLLALHLPGCAEPSHPRGVIVVSLDTLRADRVGAWGNPDGLTPNLDRFAGESITFHRAYAQSNETVYSHASLFASLFTSRFASELAPLDRRFRLPASSPTIAAVAFTFVAACSFAPSLRGF